jgi:hypothetical protein
VAHSVPGYGTSVIRDLIPYELGGTVDNVLAADGVRCKIGDTGQVVEEKDKPTRWT